MKEYIEGDLKITFQNNTSVRKFDDAKTHGLTSFMKAVDFIVEIESHILFIEFKDPENPKSIPKDVKKFMEKFKSGKLDTDLKYKFRDTWIYEWSAGRIKKPVIYLILITGIDLDAGDLTNRIDELRKNIPMYGPQSTKWSSFIEDCLVLNIEKWNEKFTLFPIERLINIGD